MTSVNSSPYLNAGCKICGNDFYFNRFVHNVQRNVCDDCKTRKSRYHRTKHTYQCICGNEVERKDTTCIQCCSDIMTRLSDHKCLVCLTPISTSRVFCSKKCSNHAHYVLQRVKT